MELLKLLEAIAPKSVPPVVKSDSKEESMCKCIFTFFNLHGLVGLFFEVNKAELLRTVPKDCITVLSSPPPFPGSAAPSIPKEVQVVTLNRDQNNPLLSKTYGSQLFDRVEVYFRRFFSPRDPSHKVTLDRVDVIFNDKV